MSKGLVPEVELLADELDKAKARIKRLEDVVEMLARAVHEAAPEGHYGFSEHCTHTICLSARALTEEPR